MSSSNAAVQRKIRAQTNHSTNKDDAGLGQNTNSAHGINPEYHLQMERDLDKLEHNLTASTNALNSFLLRIPGYTTTDKDNMNTNTGEEEEEQPNSFENLCLNIANVIAKKTPSATGNIRIYTEKVTEVFNEVFQKYTREVDRLTKLVQENASEIALIKSLFQRSRSEIYVYRRMFAAQNLQFSRDFSFHGLDMLNASSEHTEKVNKFFDKKQEASTQHDKIIADLKNIEKIDLKTGKARKSTRGRGTRGGGRGGGLNRESERQEQSDQ